MGVAIMDEEARQGFLGASLALVMMAEVPWRVVLGVSGLRGLDDAPAEGGSAGRHTDVRGSGPHVGYPQEVAPD